MRRLFHTLPARSFRLALLSAAASAMLYSASCAPSGSTSTSGTGGAGVEEDMGDPALADVIYDGVTNDEALGQLLAAKAVTGSPKAPLCDSPADGAALPSTPIPAFSWHVATGAMLPSTPAFRFAGGSPSTSRTPLALLAPLSELLGPERAASAHGAPLNGTAYLLVFATDADPKLVRVFTASTSYTPDATAWDKLRKAGGTITLSIVSGIFDTNNLASDGGPFEGKSVKFTVKP